MPHSISNNYNPVTGSVFFTLLYHLKFSIRLMVQWLDYPYTLFQECLTNY